MGTSCYCTPVSQVMLVGITSYAAPVLALLMFWHCRTKKLDAAASIGMKPTCKAAWKVCRGPDLRCPGSALQCL
jgi:hypothetical protein